MSRTPLTVEPRSQPLDDWSVTAELEYDRAAGRVEVLVVISRGPGLPPLLGEDLDVEVLSAGERPLRLDERPSGPLVEFGGSLGMSVNARLTFDSGGAEPMFLVVAAHGTSVRFRILPAARQ